VMTETEFSSGREHAWELIDGECARRLASCPSADTRARMREAMTAAREMARAVERFGAMQEVCRCGRDHRGDGVSVQEAWATAEMFFELVGYIGPKHVRHLLKATVHNFVNHGPQQVQRRSRTGRAGRVSGRLIGKKGRAKK
jgi:hypothetical protein